MKIRTNTTSQVAILDRLIGSKTGLISEVLFENVSRDMPGTLFTDLVPANIDVLYNLEEDSFDFDASGKGETKADAMFSVVGEFVERYCAFHPIWNDVGRFASYAEISQDGSYPFDFDSFFLHDAEHYTNIDEGSRPGPNDEIRWIEGTELPSGEKRLLPHWLALSMGTSPHWFLSSNGCAAGQSAHGAAFRGLMELIERDAVMRCWYNKTVPNMIDLSRLPTIESFRRTSEPAGASIHLVEFSSPTSVNTLGAICVREGSGWPNFSLAASAHPDFSVAAHSAIREIAQVEKLFRKIAISNPGTLSKRFEVLELGDNVIHYADPSQFDKVKWLLSGDTVSPDIISRDIDSYPELLQISIDALSRESISPVIYDFTTLDIRDIGMCVFKACAPELVPLAHPEQPPVGHSAIASTAIDRDPHPLG